MQRLFLSAIFSISAVISNAQQITINVFQTSKLNGYADESVAQLIQNTESEIIDTIPYTFTYEVNFNTKKCVLKDENGFMIGESDFIIKSKKSDRNFQIEFVADGPGAASGIVVTETASAYYIDDTMLFYCTIFKTSFIF